MARLKDLTIGMDSFDRGREEEIPVFSFAPQGSSTLTYASCNNAAIDSLCSSVNTAKTYSNYDTDAKISTMTANSISINGDSLTINTSTGAYTLQDKLSELAGALKNLETRFDEAIGANSKNEFKNKLLTGGIVRLTRSQLRTL